MTSSELIEHQGTIELLKPLINTPEFEPRLKSLTEHLSKAKQFLIKMELKRLTQPCRYYIDLRGRVKGEIQPYEHQGRVHYFDEQAKRLFEQGIASYGAYTIGVFEQITQAIQPSKSALFAEHHSNTPLKEFAALEGGALENVNTIETTMPLETVPLIKFTGYPNRHEERMHYALSVKVTLSEETSVQATTQDVSVSGIKIKIPNGTNFQLGQEVTVSFQSLSKEYVVDFSPELSYKIMGQETLENATLLRLKRLAHPEESLVTRFFEHFIHTNKQRFKVNIDNTYQAIYAKGYEQFFIPRMSALPVFINVKDKLACAHALLSTENSRAVVHYFQDEQHQSVLSQIITTRRLKQCLAKPEHSTILYCFTHAAKGRLYFYSATKEELDQKPELASVFIGFGAKKPSWRLFHLDVARTHPKDAHRPLSLPNSVSQEVLQQNLPPSATIKDFIEHTRFVATLTELSTEQTQADYLNVTFDAALLNQLQMFGHAKLDQLPVIENAMVQYLNLRSESRYLYKTPVHIEQVNAPDLLGFTRDFSNKGLQVECFEPVPFSRGDTLLITLPDMQKITNKLRLKALPYVVVAVSKNQHIMNLKVIDGQEEHQGKQFFKQLIANNASKLTPAAETPKLQGLELALRNMYLQAHTCFAFYIHRLGLRYTVKVVAQGAKLNSLHRLLQCVSPEPDELNLLSLLNNNATNLKFASQLKKMKRHEVPFKYEMFMSYRTNSKTSLPSLEAKFDFDFTSQEQRAQYVSDSVQQGLLFVYRLFLSRTGRPDVQYVAKELNYVTSHAMHKAKELEEEFWRVTGVGEVVDITEEAFTRLHLSQEQISQQALLRQELFLSLQAQPSR